MTQGLFLQIRIEQVLTGSLPLVLCFKLSQLLAFYGRTVEQMMGSNAQLTHTLVECHQLSNRVFHEQLKARGSRLLHHKAVPLKDLAVPQQVSPTNAAAAAVAAAVIAADVFAAAAAAAAAAIIAAGAAAIIAAAAATWQCMVVLSQQFW